MPHAARCNADVCAGARRGDVLEAACAAPARAPRGASGCGPGPLRLRGHAAVAVQRRGVRLPLEVLRSRPPHIPRRVAAPSQETSPAERRHAELGSRFLSVSAPVVLSTNYWLEPRPAPRLMALLPLTLPPSPRRALAADALANMCNDLTFTEALRVLVVAPIANLCIFSLPVINFVTIPARRGPPPQTPSVPGVASNPVVTIPARRRLPLRLPHLEKHVQKPIDVACI